MQSTRKAHHRLVVVLFSGSLLVAAPQFGSGQFVAFWDHTPGTNQTQTHTNTSLGNNIYGMRAGRPVFIKNITNGADTGVTMILTNYETIYATGWAGVDPPGGTPAPGTPLYDTFYYRTTDPDTGHPTNYSYVYFGRSGTGSNIKVIDAALDHVFCGLNPAARYSFRGGAVRAADPSYLNRWTSVEITGAESFTPRMTSNVLTHSEVSSLGSNLVAVSFACNHTPESGDMVGWDDINPGLDGTFTIRCNRYTGVVPGGSSDGEYGYAITGIRFEETLLSRLAVGLNSNGTVHLSWTVGGGQLQVSTNLDQWSDCPLTNGAVIAPAENSFFRLRQ